MTPFDGQVTDYHPDTKPDVALEPWRKALEDAADYIEAHGWCQNAMESPCGKVCLEGAIRRANGITLRTLNEILLDGPAWLALNVMWRYLGTEPHRFNDTPGRTAEQVRQALRECARQP